ncbi:MAG: YciI family protein [Actinomycetota bacterium]
MAWDGTDDGARDRRLEARAAHLERIRPRVDAGEALVGGAILDDDGGMIGSVLLMDFETREALDEWLSTDPYMTGHVWERVDVRPFRTAVGAWIPKP